VVRLQSAPIRLVELLEAARRDGDGALALFLGTVRDHNQGRRVLRLEYHAYPEMAQNEMQKLRRQAIERFGVSEVVVVHRTGTLQVGDTAVAIVVAAAHRAPAFEACQWLIDTLKRTVPIWKKEHFEGGEVWIEAAPDGGS
jgi:molybdopterin synthase catalytic subunit